MENISGRIEERRNMERRIEEGRLDTPEDVARYFTEYTWLIWDYLLIGEIYQCYNEEIKMNYAGGEVRQGVPGVIARTLASTKDLPQDNESMFLDIFAQKNADGSYSFIQMTSGYSPSHFGGAPFSPPPGWIYEDDRVMRVGLCECRVEKIDGRWKIVEEWLLGTQG